MADKPLDYRGGRPAPIGGNFELFAWFFMRVSGVVLLFMALGHLAIMHLINSIETIDYWFVAERWGTPFWRTYDAVMLILALLHGVNGLRTILNDFLRPGAWRTFWLTVLYVFSFILLAVGMVGLLTFQPQP